MSNQERIRKILSILLIAVMVLSYNSSVCLSVWAAGEDAPAAEEEMSVDSSQTETSEDPGDVAEAADQSEQNEADGLNEEPLTTDEQEAEPGEEESSEPEEVEGTDATASETAEASDEAETAETADEAEAADDADEDADLEEPSRSSYQYEDSNIKVTAVLTDVAAIPDDAELVVTPVTKDSKDYNYDAYMEALNKELSPSSAETTISKGFFGKLFGGDEDDSSAAYSEENTILYDIAFIVDENGEKVEVQPESGKVNIKVSFTGDQLTEVLGAESADDVQVVHLPLSDDIMAKNATTSQATKIEASDIQVEDVDAAVKVDGMQTVGFSTDSLSVWAFSSDSNGIVIPEPDADTFSEDGPRYLIDGPFGDLANFGLVGFTSITQNQHVHSNFATQNYIIQSNGEFGRRQTNQLPEVFYIGNSIDGINGMIDIFAPGSTVVLGHELGGSGKINATPDQRTY